MHPRRQAHRAAGRRHGQHPPAPGPAARPNADDATNQKRACLSDQTSATALLQDLATGRLALTHEAFQKLPNWRTAAYLRDILMQCGVLPAVDRQLLLFERWLTGHLAAVAGPEHTRVLRPDPRISL